MVTDKMVEAASKVFWLAKLERRGDPTMGDLRAALKAALAAAWVPCAERMPEPGVRVLVAGLTRFGGDFVCVAWVERGMWEGDELQDDPDFWMPLPPPPKEPAPRRARGG